MRYYLCPGMTDMPNGISSLCGVVHERMKSDVRNIEVFIFIGQSRRLMMLLYAEDSGMVVYVNRMEIGCFKPRRQPLIVAIALGFSKKMLHQIVA